MHIESVVGNECMCAGVRKRVQAMHAGRQSVPRPYQSSWVAWAGVTQLREPRGDTQALCVCGFACGLHACIGADAPQNCACRKARAMASKTCVGHQDTRQNEWQVTAVRGRGGFITYPPWPCSPSQQLVRHART